MSNFEKITEQAKIQPKEIKNKDLTPQEQNINSKSSLNIEKNKFFSHDVKIFIKLPDKESTTIDVSNYILSIDILKKYEELFKPIYNLSFNLPIEIYQKINVFKNYTIDLSIKSASFRTNNAEKDLNAPQNKNEMIQAVKVLLIPFNTNINEVNKLSDIISNNETSGRNIKIPFKNTYFDSRHIRTSFSIDSANYRNQNIRNIIMDILNKQKSNSLKNITNLVFVTPDFTEPFENITIPPMCLNEILHYLQKNYNIYNRKLNTFVDNDTLYITKRSINPPLKNQEPDIVKLIIGNETDDSTQLYETLNKISKDTNKVYVVNFKPVIENTYSSAINEIGDKLVIKSDTDLSGVKSSCIGIKDNSSTFQSMNNNGQVINEAYSGKEKFILDNTSSKGTLNLMVDEAQSKSFKIVVTIEDPNMAYFRPTTLIQLIFMDKAKEDYNGFYYMKDLHTVYNFPEDDAGDIISRSFIRLGRKFNDDGSFSK